MDKDSQQSESDLWNKNSATSTPAFANNPVITPDGFLYGFCIIDGQEGHVVDDLKRMVSNLKMFQLRLPRNHLEL